MPDYMARREDVDPTTDELTKLQAEFKAFRRQVRRIAIRTVEEQDWCVEGLNDVLKELGLTRYDESKPVYPFVGTLTLRAAFLPSAGMPTTDELQRLARVRTNDADVEVLEATMTAVDDEVYVTAEVRFAVRGTSYRDTAAEWAKQALHVQTIPPHHWFRASVCTDLRWDQEDEPDDE